MAWTGEFGNAYTDRNDLTQSQLDALYERNYGITRTNLFQEFFTGISHSARILEVGCNVGMQLQTLQVLGYHDLWGIDINDYAVEQAKQRTKQVNIVKASALDIPFKDQYFDLVFSYAMLMHISPDKLDLALDEIYRCTKKYIWSFEYYAEKQTEIEYRGSKGLLWKNDFCKLFLERYPDLKLIKQKKLKYKTDSNVDAIFLLTK